jgi:hypothetical protein
MTALLGRPEGVTRLKDQSRIPLRTPLRNAYREIKKREIRGRDNRM